ncbi:MAG: THUMP domain-containing protein [Bacteroidota bacterium]
MKLLIKTLYGLEQVLADEIRELGGQQVKTIKRAVDCEGNLEFLYRANYCLRTALKVLRPIYSFQARNEKQLYDQIRKFDWSAVMDVSQTFAIDNSIFSDFFKHSKFPTLKMKDAIADQFRDEVGRRPSVDTKRPDVQFDLHAWKDRFTVSMDSSGDTLNQRGYRQRGHQAPLNEVLAAGMLKLAGWDKEIPLVDPMCGSGTILVEAALMGMNMPPQTLRKDFGFKNWKDFNPVIWNRVKAEADSATRRAALDISGGDIDPRAVEMTKKSIKQLRIRGDIRVREVPFEQFLPKTKEGILITNPPYGERIGPKEIQEFYKTIGDLLKSKFEGFDAWVLSSNTQALKHLKLRPSAKHTLYNGGLECKFQKYELYAGTREPEELPT